MLSAIVAPVAAARCKLIEEAPLCWLHPDTFRGSMMSYALDAAYARSFASLERWSWWMDLYGSTKLFVWVAVYASINAIKGLYRSGRNQLKASRWKYAR